MTAKKYLEASIKGIQKSIESAERVFDECVASGNRNYNAIIQNALSIKAMQNELKGTEKALEAMEMCEEKEVDRE